MPFQAIAVQMGVAWGLGMLNRAMAGRPPRPPKPRPDDVEFPLTRAGAPVPIVYGTIRIDNPLLVWAGLFTSTYQAVTGTYRYGASGLFVLGVPPQQAQPGTGIPWWSSPVLRRIWVADDAISFPVAGGVLSHDNAVDVLINFGGEGNGGRFQGRLQFFDGRSNQLVTAYPAAPGVTDYLDQAFQADAGTDRSLVPGYERQMLLACLCDTLSVGSDATFGESAQFPAIAAEVSVVDVDAVETVFANPAWVLYDLICGEVWKLGYDTALVDLASFQAAATTLVTEGNGCSVRLDAEEDAEQVINGLLAQIDGSFDENPVTGKIELSLIRDPGDPSALRELNPDNTVARPRVTQTGWLENANHVDVEFTNRAKAYKPDTVPAKRLSNAISQGYRFRPRTVRYPFCMTATLAGKLAARDAALLCRPLMTVSATLLRECYDLRRGQAVRANWPQISVVDKVFRVLDIDRGQLADDHVRVTLVEDVFDQAFGAIDPPPSSVGGIDDLPVLNRIFDEAPRWLLQQAYSQGLITDATFPRVLGAGRMEPEQSASVAFSVQTKLTGAASYASDVVVQTFPTTAKVATAYPYYLEPYDTGTGLVIEDVTGELSDVFEDAALISANIYDGGLVATGAQIASGANLIRINGEMLAYESVTSLGAGQYRLNNVWRALHDTAADDHAVGDIVYWLDYDNVGTRPWTHGDALYGQPITVPVELGNFDPPTDALTIRGDLGSGEKCRHELPYRGADFRVYATQSMTGIDASPAQIDGKKRLTDFDGSLGMNWRKRNETTSSVVRGDDTTTYTVQAGATFSLLGRKVGGSEVTLATGLTGSGAGSVVIGAVGHGEIDLLVRTEAAASAGASWQDSRVRVTAHRARNLLGNGAGADLATNGWTEVSGTIEVPEDTTSLEQTATGTYFRALTGVVS